MNDGSVEALMRTVYLLIEVSGHTYSVLEYMAVCIHGGLMAILDLPGVNKEVARIIVV